MPFGWWDTKADTHIHRFFDYRWKFVTCTVDLSPELTILTEAFVVFRSLFRIVQAGSCKSYLFNIKFSKCRYIFPRNHEFYSYEILLQTAATCPRWFLAPGFFYPEDGDDTFLRNVGSHKIYMAPHPRRRHSSWYMTLRTFLRNENRLKTRAVYINECLVKNQDVEWGRRKFGNMQTWKISCGNLIRLLR
jgi:hypothetical protein